MGSKYTSDFTTGELKDVHLSLNPTLTSARKLVLNEVISALEEETDDFNEDIVKDLVNGAWKQELCRMIMETACDIADGTSNDWGKIQELAERSTTDLTNKQEYNIVCLEDMFDLFDADVDVDRWDFNYAPLQEATDGLPKTSFGIIAARPEVGKTGLWVSLCCNDGGFLDQGAKVHVWRNEESYSMVGRRIISSLLNAPKQEAHLMLTEYKEKVESLSGDIFVIKDDVTAGADITKIEEYVINNVGNIDILIVDQVDNVMYNGRAASDDHDLLGKLYSSLRQLANKYGVAIMAITQAGAGADGKLYYGYNDLYGSKTNKAATGDYVFCVGARSVKGDEVDTGFRALNFAKNKLKGPHAPISYVLDHKVSRINE